MPRCSVPMCSVQTGAGRRPAAASGRRPADLHACRPGRRDPCRPDPCHRVHRRGPVHADHRRVQRCAVGRDGALGTDLAADRERSLQPVLIGGAAALHDGPGEAFSVEDQDRRAADRGDRAVQVRQVGLRRRARRRSACSGRTARAGRTARSGRTARAGLGGSGGDPATQDGDRGDAADGGQSQPRAGGCSTGGSGPRRRGRLRGGESFHRRPRIEKWRADPAAPHESVPRP